MSKKLEQFVKDNREDFDKFEPGPVVWHNIQQQLKKPAQKQGILISMKMLRWSAAAAIIIILGAGAYYFINHNKTGKEEQYAKNKPETKATNNLPVVTNHDSANKETPVTPQNLVIDKTDNQQLASNNNTDDAEYNEELVHYTRLVELKQNQIMKIKTTEPLLYQKFAGDINKLDSTFHTLKKQLPVNPNREQILEAMIQNLQFQEALLNQQLNIIKKIKQTKKAEYEKAYRSA